jgi:D-xylulose reductase
MRALVLEQVGELALREIAVDEALGPRDVRVALRTVGVCGSDVHYYTHGRIGPFVVEAPMILGHEAAGVVVEVGRKVRGLAEGDRVCMEPGIPDPASRASRLGKYNLNPAVQFWATPPVHSILRPTVVHPADFTFELPDNVSLAAGAMVEPLAVGVHAATKAQVQPGDLAVSSAPGPSAW